MSRKVHVPLSPQARLVMCDPVSCVGCQLCEFACAAVKDGTANILRSRIRLVRQEPIVMMSVACRGCAEPACVKVCPREGALSINPSTRLIDVDNGECDGCGWCIDACPFGVIVLNPDTKRVIICDLCAARAEGPACVEVCPKDALRVSSPKATDRETRPDAVRKLLDEIVQPA